MKNIIEIGLIILIVLIILLSLKKSSFTSDTLNNIYIPANIGYFVLYGGSTNPKIMVNLNQVQDSYPYNDTSAKWTIDSSGHIYTDYSSQLKIYLSRDRYNATPVYSPQKPVINESFISFNIINNDDNTCFIQSKLDNKYFSSNNNKLQYVRGDWITTTDATCRFLIRPVT